MRRGGPTAAGLSIDGAGGAPATRGRRGGGGGEEGGVASPQKPPPQQPAWLLPPPHPQDRHHRTPLPPPKGSAVEKKETAAVAGDPLQPVDRGFMSPRQWPRGRADGGSGGGSGVGGGGGGSGVHRTSQCSPKSFKSLEKGSGDGCSMVLKLLDPTGKPDCILAIHRQLVPAPHLTSSPKLIARTPRVLQSRIQL